MINTTSLGANIRELVVHASRGNEAQVLHLAGLVQADLRTILASPGDTPRASVDQTQQTLFAIDEVLTLAADGDLPGALGAARDASKEWRSATAEN